MSLAGEKRRKRILEMLGLDYNDGKSFLPKKSGLLGAYMGEKLIRSILECMSALCLPGS